MNKILSIAKNKYFLASAFFIIWMFFFDENDMISRMKVEQEINKLETDKHYYSDQVEKLKEIQRELNENPKALERFAREKYYMKKNGEDVYVFIDEK